MDLKCVLLLLCFTTYIINSVYCLTCLSCNSIMQPRHCHEVAICDTNEICGAERLPSAMGFQSYQLGCVSKSTCSNRTSTGGIQCKECCTGDLCNADLCREPGYPSSRGPICYECKYHTAMQPCRRVQFCSQDEECSIQAVNEFGDIVLTSGCQNNQACQASAASTQSPALVGKRALNVTTPPPPVGNSVCNQCCSQDLCNFNCTTIDQCATSSCKHGTCIPTNSTAACSCSPGWIGSRCDQRDYCSLSPCINGNCSLTATGYTCTCAFGWSGRLCDVSIFTTYGCDFDIDTCTWTQSRTDDFDWIRHSGSTSSTATGPSRDHTTGSGYYMYIEASNAQTGNKADLISKLLPAGPLGQQYCLDFALHMYGAAMGSVNVYVEPERKTKVLVKHFKQSKLADTSAWNVQHLPIPAQSRNFSVIIQGVRGTDYQSDAAIDDVHIRPGSC